MQHSRLQAMEGELKIERTHFLQQETLFEQKVFWLFKTRFFYTPMRFRAHASI